MRVGTRPNVNSSQWHVQPQTHVPPKLRSIFQVNELSAQVTQAVKVHDVLNESVKNACTWLTGGIVKFDFICIRGSLQPAGTNRNRELAALIHFPLMNDNSSINACCYSVIHYFACSVRLGNLTYLFTCRRRRVLDKTSRI